MVTIWQLGLFPPHAITHQALRNVDMTDSRDLSRNFSHRFNSDGTVDSICRECFITVASERRELDLGCKERLHSCDPGLVEHYHRPVPRVEPVQGIQRRE